VSDRATCLLAARVYLNEAARRRHQHAFHAQLLRWAANCRRRAQKGYQADLFGAAS
jgi:hypothetical protein